MVLKRGLNIFIFIKINKSMCIEKWYILNVYILIFYIIVLILLILYNYIVIVIMKNNWELKCIKNYDKIFII